MPVSDHAPSEVDDIIDFEPRTESTTPAHTRLRSVEAAASLYVRVRDDDDERARRRTNIDRMVDGAPPYQDAQLRAAGQGGRCNINYGEGRRHIDRGQAGYIDLITSPEFLVSVRSDVATAEVQQAEADAILNEELTGALRAWPEFVPRFLTLTTEFLKHGVAAAFFPDNIDWRFRVAGLKDFKFPSNARVAEDALDVAFAHVEYTVQELFDKISDEDVAAKQGWNVAEVKKVILENATRADSRRQFRDWEGLQQRVKEGASSAALLVRVVRCLHTWVKETDGTVSHYMFPETFASPSKADKNKLNATGRSFMFVHEKALPAADRGYVLYADGVGNGTLHSIRGYGHRIFPSVQYLNRLQCQAADAAAISGGVMVQPNSMEDLRELAVQFYGPYSVLRPNVDIVDKKFAPDLTRNMIPVINDLRGQLQETSDFYSTAAAAEGSPYRNQLQVRAELEGAAKLSAANLAMFYTSHDRLIREVVRRVVEGPKSDPLIREFHERCLQRGLTPEQISSIDHRRTRAARAIGAGNPAARAASLVKLERNRPYYSEVGNRNLTFDITAAEIGHEEAKRYAPVVPEVRGTTEQSVAALENTLIFQVGAAPPVLPEQLHGAHLEQHLPVAQQLIDAITSGQLAPEDKYDTLAALATHLNEHARALAADPTQTQLVSAVQDVSNKLGQIVENTERALEADGAAGGDQPPAKDQELMRTAELKRRILEEDAATKRAIREADAEQAQRLADFKFASEQAREAARQNPLDAAIAEA